MVRVSSVLGTVLFFFAMASMAPAPSGNTLPRKGPTTVSWNNPLGGNWGDMNNWSPNLVPGSADTVLIDLAGTYTVNVDVSVLIFDMTIGGGTGVQTVVADNQPIMLTGDLTINPSGELFVANGADLSSSPLNTITNNGLLVVEDAFLNFPTINLGTFYTKGNALINELFVNQATATIVLEGNPSFGTVNTSFNAPGGLTNLGLIQMFSTDPGADANLIVSGGNLDNLAGASIDIQLGSGGNRSIQAPLINNGSMFVNAAASLNLPGATHVNNGLIQLSGGDFFVVQAGAGAAFSNDGIIDIAPSLTFNINGGELNPGTGSIGYTPAAAKRALGPPSSLRLENVSLGTGTLTNNIFLFLIDSIVNGGTNLVNQGNLIVHGTNTIIGGFTNAIGAFLRVEGFSGFGAASLTFPSPFINEGEIWLDSPSGAQDATLEVSAGTLTNLPTGVILCLSGGGGQRFLKASLDNQGMLSLQHPLTLETFDAGHVNRGNVNLFGGGLTVVDTNPSPPQPDFQNLGVLNLESQPLVLTDMRLFNDDDGVDRGEIFGGGLIDVVMGAFTNNGDLFANGPAPFSTGSLLVNGDVDLGNNSRLLFEIGGLVQGTDYDFINISGQITLDGIFASVLINGFNPNLGDMFQVMSFGALQGLFSQVLVPPLGNGLSFAVTTSASGVLLDVQGLGPINTTQVFAIDQSIDKVAAIDAASGAFFTLIDGGGPLAKNPAVSPNGDLLYVPNAGDGTVTAIDARNDSPIATIPGFQEPHGVAFTPDGSLAWVVSRTGGGSGRIDLVDTMANTIVGSYSDPCLSLPEDIVIDRFDGKAYVVNSGNGTVCVIDTTTQSLLGTVVVGGNPTHAVMQPDAESLFVANTAGNNVARIDTETLAVTPIAVPGIPAQLDTSDGGKVYVATQTNAIAVIDTATNAVSLINAPAAVSFFGAAVVPGDNRGYFSDPIGNQIFVVDLPTDTLLGQPIDTTPDSIAAMVANKPQVLSAGNFELSANAYNGNEDAGTIDVRVRRVGGRDGMVSVDFDTMDGSALDGLDYTGVSQTLVFAGGDRGPIIVAIPIIDDLEVEGPEFFTVDLSNPMGGAGLGTITNARVDIIDNDMPQPPEPGVLSLSAATYSIGEVHGSLAVDVVRSGGTDGIVNCLLSTTPGTASAGTDYDASNYVVTFGDDEAGPVTIEIPIFDDNISESPETFNILLSNPGGGATLGAPDQAVATIFDDDLTFVSWEISQRSVAEGDSDNRANVLINVRARLSAPSSEGILIPVSVGGSATAGEDYRLAGTALTIPPNSTSESFLVTILGDDTDEPNETLILTLAGGNALLEEPTVHTLTIADNDPPPQVNWSMVPEDLLEGVGVLKQDQQITLTARLARPSSFAISVPFGIGGSAQPGTDHDLAPGELFFAPGSIEASVAFQLFDDTEVEPVEAIIVNLLQGGDAPVGPDFQRIMRIQDNDIRSVSWTTQRQNVLEDDSSPKRSVAVNVTAQLSAAAAQTLQVPYQVGGTATFASDHDLVPGTLAFAPGTTQASLSFHILGDTLEEAHEVVVLTLLEGSVQLGRPRRHVLTIQDNDRGQSPDTQILAPGDHSEWRVGQTIAFQATGSDPQGDGLGFFWEICGSTGADCRRFEGVTLEGVSFDIPAIYHASCYAVDEGGNVDRSPARVSFRVSDNIPPHVRILSPAAARIGVSSGDTVAFLAEASDPDSDTVLLEWFLTSAPEIVQPGATFSRRFDEPGDFIVVCRARDGEGATATALVNVRVSPGGTLPDAVRISEPPDGSTVLAGEPLGFVGQLDSSTSAKREIRLFWLLGDGRTKNGQILNDVVFEEPGRYQVRLYGLDSENGLLPRDEITLFVVDPTLAPGIDIDIPTDLEIQPGNVGKRQGAGEVFFKAFNVDQNGHQNLRYFWDFGDGRTSMAVTPGRITFENEGVYNVSLYAVTADGLQSETSTRTITVRTSSDTSFEPNDNLLQAPPITPGSYENLLVDDTSSEDFYRIEVPRSGQSLEILLNLSDAGLVEILDGDGRVVSAELIRGEGNLQARDLAAGEYFLRISPAPNAKRVGFGYSIGVSVLNPDLYFPDVQVSEFADTQLGFVNITGSEAALEVIGYDALGNILDRVALNLPPRGRIHQGVARLFGGQAGQVAWVRVDSDQALTGYSRTESRDFQEVYGLSASKKLSSELFVPHIAERTDQWFTRASVINGDDQGTFSEIRTPTLVTDLDLDQGYTRDAFDFLTKLGGTLPDGSVWATFKETAENPVLAGSEVFGTLDGNRIVAGLALADVRRDNPNFTFIGNNLYYTHIARDVANFYTGIALVNIGAFEQGVRMRAYGPGGALVGEKTVILAPNEKLVQVAEDFLQGIGSPANVDWMVVEAGSDVVGFELFGTHDGKRLAGLEATSALSTRLCYPFIDDNDEVVHGISVVNVADLANRIELRLYDDGGQEIAMVERVLNPHEKLIATIEELFDTDQLPPEQIPGWLSCDAEHPIAGFELFINDANQDQMGAIIAQ